MVVNGVNIYNEWKNKLSYGITENDILNVCKFSDKISFYSLTLDSNKKILESFGVVI